MGCASSKNSKARVLNKEAPRISQSQKMLETDEYLKRYYPGRELINVAPDGGCMSRAIAFCLFKDDEHWKWISKAVNDFIRENFPLIREWLSFPISLRLGVSGQEIELKNEGEYIEFLKRKDALYIWRDYWDLLALSEFLHMRITVLRVNDDKIETVQKIEPISGQLTEEDDRIVLLLKGEHYYAIVHPTD